jgi:hypothetical protein
MGDYLNVAEVLRDAQERVAEVRRTLCTLKPHLIGASTEAMNLARRNVCDSLIRRFEIAEKEMRELEDMIAMDIKLV